jgi:hypothetical protein
VLLLDHVVAGHKDTAGDGNYKTEQQEHQSGAGEHLGDERHLIIDAGSHVSSVLHSIP